FVPAAIALRVARTPPVTPVPGAPAGLLGIALHEGGVVPVLEIGPARGDMIVCRSDGELVALLGGEGFVTGVFTTAGDGLDLVEHEGRRHALLDVAALCATIGAAAGRR
ncbi:MAG: hypothetical protein ACRENE_05200, partial [Polyangiaceae bacterium]